MFIQKFKDSYSAFYQNGKEIPDFVFISKSAYESLINESIETKQDLNVRDVGFENIFKFKYIVHNETDTDDFIFVKTSYLNSKYYTKIDEEKGHVVVKNTLDNQPIHINTYTDKEIDENHNPVFSHKNVEIIIPLSAYEAYMLQA